MLTSPQGTYSYDANGNLTSVSNKQYGYDLFNRLTSFSDGTTTASYTYNGDGQRMSKTVNGVTKYFVWHGANVVLEYEKNSNGAIVNSEKYIYAPDGILAKITSSGAVVSYAKDGKGSVNATIDANRNVIETLEYDAYGKRIGDNANSAEKFGYAGEYFDSETGLIYLRNRYFDPTIRVFITQDPAMDGSNWYSYCAGNPVMFVDPLGLEYGKLRDFVYDYYGAFGGDVKIETADGLNFAYVTMGDYERAFYFDGTIVEREYDEYTGQMISEDSYKIADNINGNLYMQRSAFVAAMGMVENGNAQVQTSDEFYVNDLTAIVDFASYINGSVSSANDIKDIYDLFGEAPTIGKVVRNLAALGNIVDSIKNGDVLSTGYYRAEAVSVQVGGYKHVTQTMYGTENKTRYYQFYVKYPSWYGIPSAPEYK